ncbi:unnamed protein product [Effrenium voratum]|nr:unnamed protein product [Effrenium voratum]
MMPCVPAMGPMLAVQAMQMGQPAVQMNVVAMPLMPGQCIVAVCVPAELQTIKDHASAASQDEPELHNRQRRKPATKPQSWQPGPVAAGLVCNPAADFFAQHSQERLQMQLQGNQQEVTKALEALKGHVWDLSCHQAGCRLVQLALESASQQQACELASELKGHVQQAMASPHANYVVQKIVTRLLWQLDGDVRFVRLLMEADTVPSNSWRSCSFVAEELLGAAVQMSHQRFGCRIFCRLLEFHARQETTLRLVDEILQDAADLCCHPFGHHVVQSILEHGFEQHCDVVARVIGSDVLGFAKDQNASYLVEKVLCTSSPAYQEALLAALWPFLADLAVSRFGCYVARAVVEHPRTHRATALEEIRMCLPELRKTKHGQLLMADLGFVRRFPKKPSN